MLEVRFPKDVAGRLRGELQKWGSREPVAFGLASHAVVSGKQLVLVRDIIVPPETAFLPSRGHGARWSGAYNIELLNIALERQLGLFVFHPHPEMHQVQMSSDDRHSALQLLPKFQMIQPNRPHGSIVIGPDSVAGMILMPGCAAPSQTFRVLWIEEQINIWPLPSSMREDRVLFERQPIARSALTDAILRDTTVAVVGLSGGGSQVVPQLVSLGVGEIIGIDPQRFDASNRSASGAVTWIDCILRRKKTSAVRSKAWWIRPGVRFIPVDEAVPGRRAIAALKRAGVIVGCVNNLHARADLMELAWRYCIPYVDIGLVLKPVNEVTFGPPPIGAIAGNVFVAVPGGPCLWCTEFLTQRKLDAESGGRGRAYLQEVSAQGGGERETYVAGFNGVLASQAVNEVLQLLLGFRTKGVLPLYKRYDGFSGTLAEWGVTRNVKCSFCRNTLAAGDLVWN